ncbi:MAG: polymer-forming cytoskeletal protein [Anaerolineales bacterium]|jgi:hypothetical protein
MKSKAKLIIFVLLILTLAWPGIASAKELQDDEVVFGGTFTLASGDSLDGSLVVFGGAVSLEQDSTVNGDVVLIGGTIEIDGLVNGNLVGVGGALRLNSHAVINGDLTTIGATLRREEGSQVGGQVNLGVNLPFQFSSPEGLGIPGVSVPEVGFRFNPVLDVIWFFFRVFMWAALAILLVLFFKEPVDRIAHVAINQPIISAGSGLLTAILAPIVLIVVTLTIILIPVSFIGILVLVVAWLLGWVALGLEVGRRIAKMFDQEWAPAIAAGVGTFVLYFVLAGFAEIVPCIGWMPRTLVGLWGLGAVVLTRFGTQTYPLESVVTPKAVTSTGGSPKLNEGLEMVEVTKSPGTDTSVTLTEGDKESDKSDDTD